jgi:YNFM family putative membrane transporter
VILVTSAAVMAAGLMLTLPDRASLIVAGLLVFTAGFFGAHGVASGWVSRRAETGRAQASALYLLAYYAGSSLLSSATGLAFSHGGWGLTVIVVGGFIAVAMALGLSMRDRLPPRDRAGRIAPAGR